MAFGHGNRLTLLFFGIILAVPASAGGISKDCAAGKECLIEVPGMICADGTHSFITLTQRTGARNLLIFLDGGGACWNKATCQNGMARPLTRTEKPTNWTTGSGIFDAGDEENPFAKDYNVITVPYCTGDVFTGNNDPNYGNRKRPYVLHHHGYENVRLAIEAAAALYPSPRMAVLLGISAGGIGAYYHMRHLAQAFPHSRRYVISDAGTPFKPPYIEAKHYQAIMHNWGADKTLPAELAANAGRAADFGAVIQYNTRAFPQTHFGLISSYSDTVMTFFAYMAGSPSPFSAVRRILIDVADHALGSNAKVFYLEGSRHVYTTGNLGETVSLGTKLSSWLKGLLDVDKGWDNVRPESGAKRRP